MGDIKKEKREPIKFKRDLTPTDIGKIEYLFWHKRNNTAPAIGKELGISEHVVNRVIHELVNTKTSESTAQKRVYGKM